MPVGYLPSCSRLSISLDCLILMIISSQILTQAPSFMQRSKFNRELHDILEALPRSDELLLSRAPKPMTEVTGLG